VFASPNSSFSNLDLEGDSATPEAILNESLHLRPGDHVFLAHRPRLPKVCFVCTTIGRMMIINVTIRREGPRLWAKRVSASLSSLRAEVSPAFLMETRLPDQFSHYLLPIQTNSQYIYSQPTHPTNGTKGDYRVTEVPHFLWVTEFPLFTHDDSDKDFLAHGRWSSSHHPFTAPMWQDIEALYRGDIQHVRACLLAVSASLPSACLHSSHSPGGLPIQSQLPRLWLRHKPEAVASCSISDSAIDIGVQEKGDRVGAVC
jgi:hypothetical protein